MFHRTSWRFDGLSHADVEVDVGLGLEASAGAGQINLFIKEDNTCQRARYRLRGLNAGVSLDAFPIPVSGSFSTQSMQSWGTHAYKGPAGSFVSAETFAGPVAVYSVAGGFGADTDAMVFVFLAMNSYASVSRFMAASACSPFGVALGTVSNIEAAMVAGGAGCQFIAGVEFQAGLYYATYQGVSYPPGTSRQRAFNRLSQDQRNLVFMPDWQIWQRYGHHAAGERVLAYRDHLREQFPNYEQYGR